MSARLPQVFVARHGETAWSLSGQHTGLTDLPLTERGERNAKNLGVRLRGFQFAQVLTSPLQRAKRTCELAGFGDVMTVDADLVEWNYGDYEGKKSAEIRATRPGWVVFRDGCPNGESVEQMRVRADRVIAALRAIDGDVLVFSSGHFSRTLAARWLGLGVAAGALFALSVSTLSILGYDHNKEEPVLKLWNDSGHVTD